MLAFIENFLKNRRIQVKANGILSNPITSRNGIPQGFVISVTLFLIEINDILINIKPPIQRNLFANDFKLTCSEKDLTTVELL